MTNIKEQKRERRHKKIRSTLSGTAETPRINVSKSLTGLFVQVIDDVAEKTLFSISTKGEKGNKTEQSSAAGKKLGEEIKKSGIEKVVFDRGGNLYAGRIQALADGLREAGLKF
jgi:large subunit ribosomal protein L18